MDSELLGKDMFKVSHMVDESPKQEDFFLHAHVHYELYLFWSGDITFLVEGNSYTPTSGDILLFNIGETHKAIINSDRPYERTVIEMDKALFSAIDTDGRLFSPFTEKQLGQDNSVAHNALEKSIRNDCFKILKNSADKLERLSAIMFLLCEIGRVTDKMQKFKEDTSLEIRIVKYINEHITENISPKDIADKFFISRTYLYSVFLKATGSNIHEYISAKRLILAHELLSNGQRPTDVYSMCGFNEYTTFYRAYKNRFGYSPKYTPRTTEPLKITTK